MDEDGSVCVDPFSTGRDRHRVDYDREESDSIIKPGSKRQWIHRGRSKTIPRSAAF